MAFQLITEATFSTTETGVKYLLEEGVTLDASGPGGKFFFDRTASSDITVQIDGTAVDDGATPIRLYSESNNNLVIVGEAGQVLANDHAAINLSGDNNALVNHGYLLGDVGIYAFGNDSFVMNAGVIETRDVVLDGFNWGIYLGGSASGGGVENAGIVRSEEVGIRVDTEGSFVFNSGKVIAGTNGVETFVDGTRIHNSGLIRAEGQGVNLNSDDTTVFTNSGKIIAGEEAIEVNQGGGHFSNTGKLVSKSGTAFTSAFGDTTFTNSGTVKGDVSMGFQNDTFFSTGTGMVDGWVLGNGGDDHLKGGAQDDQLDGGTNADTLNGGRGKDVLIGGRDDDVLAGGRDNDKLWGDARDDDMRYADDFLFVTRNTGKDKIKDFDDGSDQIVLDAALLDTEDFDDLLALGLSENRKGDAVIDFSKMGVMTGKVTLEGIAAADISADDFDFIA